MKYKRIIPVITPLLVWTICQIFLRWPGLFYSALALGALVIIMAIKYLAGKGKHDWLLWAIAPVFLFLTFSCYVAILIGLFQIQLLLFLILWFLFVYLRNLYYFFTRPDSQADFENKLDNLLIVSGFLSVFAAATVLFSLSVFITWPAWATVSILAAIVALLFIQFLPLKKTQPGKAKILILISVLGLAELAWGFSFFPLKYHLLGLFMAISYYLTLIIFRFHLRGELSRRALKLPLIMSAIAFIILLLTARWL